MTWNSKYRAEKQKNKKYRNTKKPGHRKTKIQFYKRICTNCRLELIRAEQDNNHMRIILEKQFRSSSEKQPLEVFYKKFLQLYKRDSNTGVFL